MNYTIKSPAELLAEFRESAFPNRRQLAADYDALAAERDALKADVASMTATMHAMREQREKYADERDALRSRLAEAEDAFAIARFNCEAQAEANIALEKRLAEAEAKLLAWESAKPRCACGKVVIPILPHHGTADSADGSTT